PTFEELYGEGQPVVGEYTGVLNNNGELIELQDAVGRVIQSFTYRDGWIEITDGVGFSLTALAPGSQDVNALDAKAGWRASGVSGGTPGYDDSDQAMMPGAVTINEVLNARPPESDWIELKNNTNSPVEVGGWYLSDNAGELKKYRIADGTVIEVDGYLVLRQDLHFGNADDPGSRFTFGLDVANGETLYLHGANLTGLNGYADEVDFGAYYPDVSFGRVQGDNMVRLQSTTPGSPNALPTE
ncbi:MAG: lamin tail domain-containing protein, partial [Phycisphaeraceae bacterium]|nr:lamin tail domain-containing protein [Phycisphaeraceae bacterium]